MKLRNFTPHAIAICNDAGEIVRTLSSEGNARVGSWTVPAGEIDGVPVVETKFGTVEGLPAPEEGTFLIVSQIVLAALPGRSDLLRPDTGPTCVRDAEGRIIGVRALSR